MQTEQFNKIIKQRLEKVQATLIAKADEYARGDRLSNFKKIAHLNSCTPEKSLMLLVSKHIVALSDFINDIDAGTIQSTDRWDEKIGDIIAYMVLLDALVMERPKILGTTEVGRTITQAGGKRT